MLLTCYVCTMSEISDELLEQFLLNKLPPETAFALQQSVEKDEDLLRRCRTIKTQLLDSATPEDEVEPTDEQIAGITNDEPTVVEKENVDPWQEQMLKRWAHGSNTDSSDEKTIS